MFNQRITLITAAALLLSSAMPVAAESEEVKTLVEQGKNWQALGKKKQAGDVWRKLLLIEPNSPDALYGLGLLELDEQRVASAQAYLDRLLQVAPGSKQALSLEQEVKLAGNGTQTALAEARVYAKNNEADKAIDTYRTLFGGKPPQGRTAFEYYQVLRTTPQGWEEAKDGLARLVRENPNDNSIALSYAQTLTWRVPTRREGIRLLEKLAERSDSRQAAMESWRSALTLPGPAPTAEDLQQIRNYLAKNPDDAEIRKLLTRPVKTAKLPAPPPKDPVNTAVSSATEVGMSALEQQDTATAEYQFNKILALKPNDNNALGGLGVIRMRQGRHEEARQLLSRAAKLNRARWSEALASASYWSAMQQAQAAKQRNDLVAAKAAYTQANQAMPSGLEAQLGLAANALDAGQWPEAEKRYQQLLKAHPDNTEAIAGMLSVYMQTNRQPEASKLLSNLPPSMISQPEVVQSLRKRYAENLANSAKLPNLPAQEAQARLEEALRYDPQSRWIRLNLAYQYFNAGRKPEARGLVDGLLAEDSSNTDALYAYALLANDAKRYDQAAMAIQRIPESSRSADATALYRRAWFNGQLDRANSLVLQGQQAQAVAVLRQLEPYAQQEPEWLVPLSSAYVDVKEPQYGLQLMRNYMMRMPQGSSDALLQYANLLTKMNQDVEAAGVIQELQRRNLSLEQRKSLENLQVGMSIRRAESLREAGDLVNAYDTLAPALATRPNDNGVLGALARMYAAAHDYPSAAALYQRMLTNGPVDAPLYLSAAQATAQSGDNASAEQLVDEAVKLDPDNAKTLAEAGRLYRQIGKNSKARDTMTSALKAQQTQKTTRFASTSATITQSGNPFIGVPGQRRALPTANASGATAMQANWNGNAPGQFQAATGQFQPVMMQPYATQPYPQSPYPPTPYSQSPAPQSFNPMPANTMPVSPAPLRQEAAPVQPGLMLLNAPPSAGNAYGYSQAGSYSSTTVPGATSTGVPAYGSTTTYKSKTGRYSTKRKVAPRAGKRTYTRQMSPQAAYATPMTLSPSSSQNGNAYQTANPTATNTPYAPLGYAPAAPVTAPYPAQTAPAAYAPQGYAAPATAYPQPYAQPFAQAYPPARPGRPAMTAMSPANGVPMSDTQRTQNELSQMMAEDNLELKAGVLVRNRNGESGTSQLSEVQTPIEAAIPLGEGKLVAKVTPVALSADNIQSSFDANSRFGGGPAVSGTKTKPITVPGSQDANGVGVMVGYRGSQVEANIGTTPIGFEKTNVVGNVKVTGNLETLTPVSYSVDVNRTPVTDSVLSYAGTKDPRTGEQWGGVVATGVRGQIGMDETDYGLYGYGSYHTLSGENVEKNTRYSVGGGVYVRVVDLPDSKLTAGVNLGGIFFDKNLRYFTYGHGGYFSPQSYLALTFPVTYAKRSERLSFLLGAQVGLQSFSEDNADYFPGDAARQKLAVAALSNNNQTGNLGVYEGQSKSNINYGLNTQAEYKLNQNFSLGGLVGVSNSGDFREWNGGVYLRYNMYPVTAQAEIPLSPYLSPYAVRY